jgi:hypothetical protein
MGVVTGDSADSRIVTLVLVDRSGAVLGALEPFRVDSPWWADVRPICHQVPGVTVLRLLHARPAVGHPMGGSATYLAEMEGVPPGALRAYDGVLDDHALRMPWARPGGPASDLAWSRSVVQTTGPAVQHRTWNLSSIWSIPVGGTSVWMKCVPPFFGHEPAVLRSLGSASVPRLIDAEGHRMLLEEMPGENGYGASEAEHLALIESLVRLQLETVGRTDELLAAGVPDSRGPSLLQATTDVVRRRAPTDDRLAALVDTAEERLAAVASCGLPDVLVHGDAHPGNARIGAADPIWFDWGDSRVGNPLLDLAVLAGVPETHRDRLPTLRARWLDLWADAAPGSDPWRAWRLLRPLAELRIAAVYQQFLDNIEPSEHPYHERDVAPALERAALSASRPDADC